METIEISPGQTLTRKQVIEMTLNSEQAFHRVEQEHIKLKERYERTREELRAMKRAASGEEKLREVSDAASLNMKAALAKNELDTEALQRELRGVKDERDGLIGRVARLLDDARGYNTELHSHAKRLEDNQQLRHDLQAKVDDLQGSLRTANFELHRATEAKELGDKHSKWLAEELETKQNELETLRAEKNTAVHELQHKAEDAATEATKLAGQVGTTQLRAEMAEGRIEELEGQVQSKVTALQQQNERFQAGG